MFSRKNVSVLCSLLSLGLSAHAEPGRVQFSAASANANLGIFSGDAMQPLLGDQQGFFYGDVAGDYATDATYLMSPGVGYRGISNNQIFGAYAFADYEKTNLGEYFLVLSPGVEWISPQWDAHVNLYFPTNKSQQEGGVVFADTLGNDEYTTFVPDTTDEYNMKQQPYAVIGNGADAEIGYSFAGKDNLKSRVYIGSYYYQPQGDALNILGETLGYQQAITQNFSFNIANSYDEVNHYALSLEVTLTFGGNSNEYSSSVQDRLLDPVERHVGIIDTGAGTYDQQTTENKGMALEYDNVHFVSPDSTGNGDTTYGNSGDMSQETFDTIYAEDPNGARVYVEGGSGAFYSPTTSLNLYSGQDIFGRTADYTAPAESDEQPQINVESIGFVIDNGVNTISDVTIYGNNVEGNTPGDSEGVEILDNSTVTLSNVNISGFNAGVYAQNDTTGTLTINTNNSTFNNNTNDGIGNSGANGIYAVNNSTGNLTINAVNSSFNDNTNNGDDSSSGANGIYVINNESGSLTVNATNSTFNSNLNNNVTGPSGASGIHAYNVSTGTLNINATDSQFNANTGTGDSNPGAYGIYATSSAGNLNMNLANSSFNGNTANGSNNSGADGVFVDAANLNMTVTNSTFNGNMDINNDGGSTSSAGMLIFEGDSGTINISNSQFNGNTNSGNNSSNTGLATYGLLVQASGSDDMTINVSNSQFNDNGVSGDNNAGVYGLQVINGGSGALTASITDSQFYGNSASGTSNGGGYGLYADNSSGTGLLTVSSLSGSTFSNNSTYDIFAAGNLTPGNTTVNLSGAGSATYASSGDVDFTG